MTQKEIDDANYKLAVQLSKEMEEALGSSPFYRGTGKNKLLSRTERECGYHLTVRLWTCSFGITYKLPV